MATVLYVDDEDAISRAVVTWLTRRGHTVHPARTVASACKLLESQPIDGAFIDLWLGEESGLELQAWIDEHRPDLSQKIVFVTGDVVADAAPGRSSKGLGLPVLSKPFELKALEDWAAMWSSDGPPAEG